MMNSKQSRLSRGCQISGAALLIFGSSSALAQDIELSYGADIVSNYIAKGFTQTDDDPALQAWAEAAYGIAYVGFFASNVSFGGVKDIEYDLSFGVRPTLGAIDLDIGYAQYLYRDDKTDYGEFYVKGTYDISDQAYVGFKYYREVFFDYDTLYVEAGTSDLIWGLSLSGGIGSDFGTRGLSEDAVYADIGLTKEISDHSAFDLRAHYSSIEDNRLIATLSFYN
ncbi:conserved hypothetical protein [Shimia gijangensis]|uniref:Outer membrane protein beta-barrel domain-containing protein n=1 Tax=Shimia gijangensis TaxID=1470563 RepID=A0A1M6ECL8_9RHOB|nr:TorF family putative porin [Shimia gijangensis]SHI83232.1 conserved hypothetical protein [Shimia gijangensis]